MLNLLKKEFGLTGSPITYIFIAAAGMSMIPNYPILVVTFILSIGFSVSFQTARETQDIQYSIILPVKKRDIVKAKFLFVVLIELAVLILLTLIVTLKAIFLQNSVLYAENPLMNSNIAYLGYTSICFSIFNTAYLTQYFKTATRLGKPFLIYSLLEFPAIIIFETLHHLPGFSNLNSIRGQFCTLQVTVLLIGLLIFICTTLISYRVSAKKFEILHL